MSAIYLHTVPCRRSIRLGQHLAVAIGFFLLLTATVASAQSTEHIRTRIGVLTNVFNREDPASKAFLQRLSELGYVDGKNAEVEWRHTSGGYEDLYQQARELVAHRVDIVVTDVTLATKAAMAASPTLPIVMALAADPVVDGLVSSLSRPGGRVTGLSLMLSDTSAKRLQLLNEVLQNASRIAVAWNPTVPWNRSMLPLVTAAAAPLALKLQPIAIERSEDFESAFASISAGGNQAILFADNPLFEGYRPRILELEARYRLPAMHTHKEWAEAGALMSYGASYVELLRRAAELAAKVLRGASPSEMPIEQPTSFELVINLRTAKRLGLAVPQSVLIRASEIIE